MSRLVKLQVRNIFYSKSFYICLFLLLLTSPIASFLIEIFAPNVKSGAVFPKIMDFLSSEVGIICSVFIALFSCFEFNNRTTKNIIAKGYTRTQLLFSKYIGSLIGVFSMYFITSLVIFILFIKNGLGFDSSMIFPFINSIFEIIAFVIFFATMAFVLESNGAAVVACLVVPMAITLLLTFLGSNFKLNISNYWLANISNKFIENPIFSNLCYSILGYLLYIGIFIFFGIKLSNRKEIK